jgi:alkylation response protein AidB-like acyl-CoA dehydrogenase
MEASNKTHLSSNQYLPRGPSYYQDAKAALLAEIDELAATPTENAPDFMRRVLSARLAVSEMALDAAQSALLHAGSRGYLQGSAVSRVLRESYFVAIITPSIRHLRKELAVLGRN